MTQIKPDYIRQSLHAADIDDSGHDLNAGGTPVVMYAEYFAAGPVGSAAIDYTAFFDVDGNDTSLVVPAGMGLSYSAGGFTATEDGVWSLFVGADIVTNPGAVISLIISQPGYGSNNHFRGQASGNPDEWETSRLIPMKVGGTFSINQTANPGDGPLINGYLVVDIIRIARGVS